VWYWLWVLQIVHRPTVPRRVGLAAAAGLLVATTVAGCTGDDDDSGSDPAEMSAPSADGSAAAETLQRKAAPQQVSVRTVWGRWPGGDSSKPTQQLARQAGGVVTAWMDRAYVGVDYPTAGQQSVDGAFATFTSGAERDARRQDHLTTAVDIGADLVDVVPTRRTVQLVAFAPHGRAVGATAVVTLVLLGLRADGSRVEVAVTGDLYLTRPGRSWQVFGYDLQRSTGAPGSYARSQHQQGQQGQQGSGGDR